MKPYLKPKPTKGQKTDWGLEWDNGEPVTILEALILKERLDDFISHWVRAHEQNSD